MILAVAAVLALAIGCTTRPEISEELDLQGNHSAGELAMVTTDTSSDGFQYLDPDISPDGRRIVFSADWAAIPPLRNNSDEIPLIRQIAVVGLEQRDDPMMSLRQSGGELVYLRPFTFATGNSDVLLDPHMEQFKGEPIWVDDTHVIYWMTTPRGARLFLTDVPDPIDPEALYPAKIVYREEDDDLDVGWKAHEHLSPALSPDGRWIAYSHASYENVDSLNTASGQSIWVMEAPSYGQLARTAFPVTREAAIVGGPEWSPDGTRICFHATTDVQPGEESDYYSRELYTIDFDTTGLAATDTVALNRNITRLTYSPLSQGSVMKVRNMNPAFSPDGQLIAFESDRRAPAVTLRDRNIWYIPQDGSLDPQLLFFSRADDRTPVYTGNGRQVLISSAMGFPTEMLDDIWQRTYDSIAARDSTLTEVQIEELVNAERQELEFFEGVMHHLYRFDPR